MLASSVSAKEYTIEDKLADEGQARVIVYLPEQPAQAKAMRSASRLTTMSAPGLENQRELPIINGYAGTMTAKDYKDLKRRYPQAVVQEDRVFYLQNLETQTSISVPSIGANYSWAQNRSGTNITIAIIDSGVHYNHSDLGGCFGAGCKVASGYDYVDSDADPDDDNGHGTHVAGIAAGNGTIKGVAPNATIMALRACDASNACYQSAIISSLSYAVNNSADVISMSIGGSGFATTTFNMGTDALSVAVENTVEAGIPVVISAGNQASGDDNGASSVSVPGATASSISVAAYDDRNTLTQTDDTIASFSLQGPAGFGRVKPDIGAPGVSIYSTDLSNNYKFDSGTSMSAPHVSGAIALLLEQEPNLTPQQIRARMLSSSYTIGEGLFVAGTGGINITRLLTSPNYALVNFTNTYGSNALDDRWETIAYPNQINSANITLYANESTNFTLSLSTLEDIFTASSLNTSFFSYQTNSIASNTATIQINITVNESVTPGTYGGVLEFSANTSKPIRVPIAITVPFTYTANTSLSFDEHGQYTGDHYQFAYYNPYTGNDTFAINWTSGDIDMWLHDSQGNYIDYSATVSNPETLTLTNTSIVKWVRLHMYDFGSGPIASTFTITDNDNTAPILNVTEESNNQTILAGQNITINISLSDDDNATITFNQSGFGQVYKNSSNAQFTKLTNTSNIGLNTVTVTITDLFGLTQTAEVNYTVINASLNRTNYTPSNFSPSINSNESLLFTVNATDFFNQTIIYTWFVNGTVQSNNTTLNISGATYNATITLNVTAKINTSLETINTTWQLSIFENNDAPTFNDTLPNISMSEDTINYTYVNLSNYFNDTNNDTLTYTLQADNITLQLNGTTAHLTPDTNYFGNQTAYFTATDGQFTVESNNFTIEVNNTNDAVTFSGTISDQEWGEDQNKNDAINLANYFTDADLDTLTYTLLGTSDIDMTVSSNSASFSADEGFTGDVDVTIRASDGSTQATSNTFTLTVNEVEETTSSGGGAGGSSAVATQPASISTQTSSTASFTQTFTNTNTEIIAQTTQGSLEKVTIRLSESFATITLDVTQHEEVPSTSSAFTSTAYKSFSIEHEDLPDEHIEQAVFRFSVDKEWILAQENITVENIKLFRLTTQWDELPTAAMDEDDTVVNFEAVSPGLSTFIIGLELPEIEEEEEKQNKAIEETQFFLQNNETTTNTTNSTQAREEVPQADAQTIEKSTWISIVVGIVGLLIISSVTIEYVIHKREEKTSSTSKSTKQVVGKKESKKSKERKINNQKNTTF
jgi:PGF-pre-PGF domain-containing protein